MIFLNLINEILMTDINMFKNNYFIITKQIYKEISNMERLKKD